MCSGGAPFVPSANLRSRRRYLKLDWCTGMILSEVVDGPYLGFFGTDFEKTQMFNDVSETIQKADQDLQPKMAALFQELRRLNREFSKLVAEQDRRDLQR